MSSKARRMKYPRIMAIAIALAAAASSSSAGDVPVDPADRANDNDVVPPPEELDSARPLPHYGRASKSRRMAERRKRMIAAIARGDVVRMSRDDLERAELAAAAADGVEGGGGGGEFLRRVMREMDEGAAGEKDGRRGLWGRTKSDPYQLQSGMADASEYYDKWQQAYRFLGAYIDCTNTWGGGGHSHDNDHNQGNDEAACSRWALWAAYIDPDYAGNGYNEYFGDGAEGTLDCHSPDSSWVLIGVYRQEFYQFIEQISKHLWSINDYEYSVATSGLKYMTDKGCQGVGYDEYGNYLYSEVMPEEGGFFRMGLYSDAKCITLNTKTKYTYDNFAAQYSNMDYTLENLNSVYNDFRYCTSCVDYPTYQDGYFIGNDGTDDGDLINQCWKFYSHDSYNCDGDCVAMASEQNTISWIGYAGKQFGSYFDGQTSGTHMSSSSSSASSAALKVDRFKANLYLTFSGIVFVSTFLAFAVAQGSGRGRRRTSRGMSSRSRRLLDADNHGGDPSRSKNRSKSRSRRLASPTSDGDGQPVRSSKSRLSSYRKMGSGSSSVYKPPNPRSL